MIVTVASGKGGTGKTTVAVSLAQALARKQIPVSILDCDVEAPNAHLFLNPTITEHNAVQILIPQVNESLCNACGRCAEACQYHAIVVIGEKTLIFPELCHGCGSCSLVCPQNAIHEVPKSLGQIASGITPDGIHFSYGNTFVIV